MKVAILDDYQGVALRMADWTPVAQRAEITTFTDHVADPDDVVARLEPFDTEPLPAGHPLRDLDNVIATPPWVMSPTVPTASSSAMPSPRFPTGSGETLTAEEV